MNVTSSDNETIEYWLADEYLNTVGCADQFQFCNPSKAGIGNETMACTPLSDAHDMFNNLTDIELNPYQTATAAIIACSAEYTKMYYSAVGRGSSSLRAQESVFTLNSGPLPNDQWHVELDNWFSVAMARLQQSLVEYVSGSQDVISKGGIVTPPIDKYEEALCHRQRIHNTGGYQNFSILGILIILVVGSILIFLGFTIDVIFGIVQTRFNKPYRRLVWISDGFLELQRMAFEGSAYEGWRGCEDSYPIVGAPEKGVPQLGGLEIIEAKHPRIKSLEEGSETSTAYEDVPMDDGDSR